MSSLNFEYDFDISFIPLDPRQGKQYSLGFDTFMNTVNTKYAFPMHLWNDYSTVDKLLSDDISKNYRDKIIKVSKDFEECILD